MGDDQHVELKEHISEEEKFKLRGSFTEIVEKIRPAVHPKFRKSHLSVRPSESNGQAKLTSGRRRCHLILDFETSVVEFCMCIAHSLFDGFVPCVTVSSQPTELSVTYCVNLKLIPKSLLLRNSLFFNFYLHFLDIPSTKKRSQMNHLSRISHHWHGKY